MDSDALRAWFLEFHPRTRPGFMVQEPGGQLRVITNMEMHNYTLAAHLVQGDLRKAAEIAKFLTGETDA